MKRFSRQPSHFNFGTMSKDALRGQPSRQQPVEGKEMKLEYLLSSSSTSEEYRRGIDVLIMADSEYPPGGYRPIDIKERIEKLLKNYSRGRADALREAVEAKQLHEKYPIKNPVVNISKQSKWSIDDCEEAVMRIIDLVKPIDAKTNALDIKTGSAIIDSIYDRGRADMQGEAVEKINSKYKGIRNQSVYNEGWDDGIETAIAAIKSLPVKKGG